MEKNTLIAKRQPPGDKWSCTHPILNKINIEKQIFNSLTEFLEFYVTETKYKGNFRLCPLKGEIYIIGEESVKETKPKFNLYDEK